jgi:hypothetical protein
MAIVKTVLNEIDAEMAASALEAAGIEVVIRRDICGGVEPALAMAGIAIEVPDADAEILNPSAEVAEAPGGDLEG